MSDIEILGTDGEPDETRAELRRRAAAQKKHGGTLVDRAFVAAVIEKYHHDTVGPTLMSFLERLTYLEMWPWQKAWYWTLKVYGWFGRRWVTARRRVYGWKWSRVNKAVMERMAKGETREEDE